MPLTSSTRHTVSSEQLKDPKGGPGWYNLVSGEGPQPVRILLAGIGGGGAPGIGVQWGEQGQGEGPSPLPRGSDQPPLPGSCSISPPRGQVVLSLALTHPLSALQGLVNLEE